MKLTALDQQFINWMVPAEKQRQIIHNKLAYKSDILLQSPGHWLVIYGRNWGMYLYFLLELLLALFKPTQPKTLELVAFDTNYQNTADRLDYFHYNLPGQPIKLINFYTRLPALPNKREAFSKAIGLLFFQLRALFQPSELSREYVRTVRACLLVHGYVSGSMETAVYLFHLHRHETAFIAAYLQQRTIHVTLVSWDAPLAAHNKYLVGDTLKLCNPYQLDEFKVFQSLGNCKTADLQPLEKIHRLIAYYKDQPIPHLPNHIGIYTQGYWLRTKLGKTGRVQGDQWDTQERELLEVMLSYLATYPDIQLTIYPHPMERRHVHQTGDYAFYFLQNHPQIHIDFSGANSMYTFNQVGLGITIMSSVGFERVYLGFRTLFYVPYVSHADFAIASPYNALYIRNHESLLQAVNTLRPMPHFTFMENYFGKQFLQVKT